MYSECQLFFIYVGIFWMMFLKKDNIANEIIAELAWDVLFVCIFMLQVMCLWLCNMHIFNLLFSDCTELYMIVYVDG